MCMIYVCRVCRGLPVLCVSQKKRNLTRDTNRNTHTQTMPFNDNAKGGVQLNAVLRAIQVFSRSIPSS